MPVRPVPNSPVCSPTPIQRLNDDTLGLVMEHLDVRSLARAVQVCRRWNGVADDTGQWLHQLKRVSPKERWPQAPNPGQVLDPKYLRRRLKEETQLGVNLQRNAYSRRRIEGAARQVPSLALSAKGDAVVAPSYQGALGTWQLSGLATPANLDSHIPGNIVAQSSDASTVAYELRRTHTNTHQLLIARNGAVVRTWNLPIAQPVRVHMSPSGSVAAIAMGDGSLWVGRVASDEALRCASGPAFATIPDSAISADGRYLAAVVYGDQTVRVWDLESNAAPREVRLAALEVTFAGDSRTLGILGFGGRVYTAKLDTPELTLVPLNPLPPKVHSKGTPHALQFGGDSRWLFALAGRYVWAWNVIDPLDNQPIRICPTQDPSEMPTALAVSADANRLLVELEREPPPRVTAERVVTRLEVWDFGAAPTPLERIT